MTGSSGLRVLVTGATSGLGREMALQLARRGFRVAVTGRREELLQETARAVEAAGGEALALNGGVDDLPTVRRHYASIKERWGGLDWAILNAGVHGSNHARKFDAANCRRIFDTNVGGTANWLEAVIPDMVAARRGTIAALSSLAGWRGLPGSAAYSASKAALMTLLESVRADLAGTGVKVVTVCPGFVKSEMTGRSRMRLMPFMLETEDGVRRILTGIERGRSLVVFPWQLALIMRLVRALPGWAYDRLMPLFVKRKSGRA